MAEGKATIIQILRPDTFTPNYEFDIRPRMRNDGAEDTFWVRLTNVATGEVLKETTRTTLEEPNGLWTSPMYITLTQITIFYARIQFGHLKNGIKVIDDTEDFPIRMSLTLQPPPVRYLLTITTTPGGCRVELYDDSDDFIFYVITTSTGYTDPTLFREGTYTVKVTKDGYNDYSTTFNLNMDRELRITLTEQGLWDWLIGFVLAGFERLLGLVSGGFATLILNIKNFLDNFTTILGDWWDTQVEIFQRGWDNVTGGIKDWIDDTYDTIGDWWTTQKEILQRGWDKVIGDIKTWVDDTYDNIGDWWNTQREILERGWSRTVDGIKNWIDETYDNIGDWWTTQKEILQRGWDNTINGIKDWIDETYDNIGDWWNDQVEILQRGWDNTISGIKNWIDETADNIGDWWDTQAEILQRGWDKTVSDINIVIKNVDIDIRLDIPKIFNDMFKYLLDSNPVVKFLYDMITGSYKDTAEMKKKQQAVTDKRKEIKAFYEDLDL